MDWSRELALLRVVADGLEEGVLVIDEDDRIVFASEPMAALLGVSTEKLTAMAPDELVAIVRDAVEVQPDVVREGRLLPTAAYPIILEEFELCRPSRSVIRWIARRVTDPLPVRIVMATDITAQSDLTVAYQKLAMTDRLTGLANRRHADQAIRRESARARRSGSALSVALVDVDFFKRINDSLGHAAGDQVLVNIAKVLTASMRDSDFASRWGGEEFLLVMADTDLAGGLICSERIRQKIENGVEAGGQRVTVSIGLAQYIPAEPYEKTIARADEKLYEAKQGGRNRVCVARPG